MTAHSIAPVLAPVIAGVFFRQLFATNVDAELVAMYKFVVEAAKEKRPFTFMAKQVQSWSPSVNSVLSIVNEVDPLTPVYIFVPFPPTIICCPSPEKVTAVAVAMLMLLRFENEAPKLLE